MGVITTEVGWELGEGGGGYWIETPESRESKDSQFWIGMRRAVVNYVIPYIPRIEPIF